MSKIINISLFIFLIVGCSYEPILLNKSSSFKFINIITNGDKDFNFQEEYPIKMMVIRNIIFILQQKKRKKFYHQTQKVIQKYLN